jgi:hypothetical protein
MRQLTGLDAQFLALETPRQSGHFSGLAVLDPSTRANGRLELTDVWKLIGWLRESLAELLPSGAVAQPEHAREQPRAVAEPDLRPATG